MNGIKVLLEELDEFNAKINQKHKSLHAEREKFTYKFEKLTQKMVEEINTRRDIIYKSIKEVHTKLESSLYDTLKQTIKIKDSVNYVRENFEEENIKNLLIHNKDSYTELSTRFKDKIKELSKEVEEYDSISIINYYDTLTLVNEKNKEESLNTGRKITRQKETLYKLLAKIAETNRTLEYLNRTIEIKKKEIESLNKIKARIIKTNDTVIMSIERQNKRFADVVGALTPERTKHKNITPENLFARENEPTNKKVVKAHVVNSVHPSDKCEIKEGIEFGIGLEDVDNFMKLITDNISSTIIALNIFALSSRYLFKPEKEYDSPQRQEISQTLRNLQQAAYTIFKLLERTLSSINANINRILPHTQRIKINKQKEGGYIVNINSTTEGCKQLLEQFPESFGHFLFDTRTASTELLKGLTEAFNVLPLMESLMESQIKNQIGVELELLDARANKSKVNWEVDTIPECNEEESDSTQRLKYVTFSKKSSKSSI